MKVYLICIAKNENKYIKEWGDWMLNKGFDKIIICDNNDEDGERISDVLEDERIVIKDYNSVEGVQPIAYTKEFLNYKDECDWLFFCDCDEFLMLSDIYENVKDFLSEDCFRNIDIIRVNWKLFSGKTQNNDYDVVDGNYGVVDRFKETISHSQNTFAKSFIRCNIEYIPNTKVFGHGYHANKNLIAVNELGKPCLNDWSKNCENEDEASYERCWLNHYPTKTIGEFVRQKFLRGGANRNPKRYNNCFKYWLTYNTRNEKEILYGWKVVKEVEDKWKPNRLSAEVFHQILLKKERETI